jgi:hypothetical protein
MKTIRRKVGRIGKMVWYLCGAILVLSLPTFSHLIPTTDLVMKQPAISADHEVGSGSAMRSGGAVVIRGNPSASRFSSFVSSPLRTVRSGGAKAPQSRIFSAPMRVSEPGAALYPPRPGSPEAAVTARGPVPTHTAGLFQQARQLADDAGSSAYPQDLSNLERGYQSAMGQLFRDYGPGFGHYAGNPFDDALPNDDKDTNGDSGNNGENGSNDNGGNNSDNPPTPPSPEPPPPPPSPGDVTPPRPYSFLVAGEFEGLGSKTRVFRARRHVDGGFELENGFKVNPFPGTVGTSVLGLDSDQQIVSDDIDGDGKQDVLITRKVPSVGTQLELYLREASGTYRKQAEASFILTTITSIVLFDFDKDHNLDVGLLFAGESNLFVYTLEDQEFKYLKEIVLPFEPSMVVDSVLEGLPRERRLYVFDKAFYRVATMFSRNPGVFFQGLVPAHSFKSFKLDSEEDGPGATDLQVFEDSGGIALAEKRGAGWVVLGRFSTTIRYPVVVFGDYVNTGTRQLFCLP